MPYTNIGELIKPYLRPLGKQTIAQIPGIQAHQLAKERLGAQKSVWSEQIAESKANREIARQAQDRLNQLSGISFEKLQPFIGEGMDPDTAMKLMMADKAKLSPLGPTKAPTPSWQNRQVRNPITGALENETFNANAPNAQLRAEVPMEQVKYGNEVIDVPAKAAGVIKAYRMAGIEKDKQFERDQADKAKTQKIKYLENAMEEDKALGKAGQESYTLHMQQLAELVGLSTAGIARDPEVDKARAMIMEAIQDIKMYEKASQDQEDKGAPLAPTSMPQMPPRQFMMPPAKKDKEMTPSQQIN